MKKMLMLLFTILMIAGCVTTSTQKLSPEVYYKQDMCFVYETGDLKEEKIKNFFKRFKKGKNNRNEVTYVNLNNRDLLGIKIIMLRTSRIGFKIALSEMERVGKKGYLMLESYRNEEELFNLQCWALTAESFFDKDEWIWLYKHFGYTGDYEFIYFK